MKPYRKIKCAGFDFKMYYPCNSINKTRSYGEINYPCQTIKIASKHQKYKGKKIIEEYRRKNQAIEKSLMHEIIHMVDAIYNDSKLNETSTERMSQGLYQVLKDNFGLKLLKR